MIFSRIHLFLAVLVCSFSPVHCQDYAVSGIPDNLKENAYAVIRKNNITCEILPGNKLRKDLHYVITIFDKSGDFLNSFVEYYDDDKDILDARLILYNERGVKVNSFKKKDFNDYSVIQGFSMTKNSRAITIKPNMNIYPYTVEYTLTSIEKDFLAFPMWIPIEDENVSIQHSEYKITVPENYKIRTKILNLDTDFEKTKNKGQVTYFISIDNYNALEDEPYSPHWSYILPHARVVPELFEMEGFAGSNASWKDYGKWSYSLIKDRDILDPALTSKLLELTKDAKNNEEKIDILFKYLQNTTRYISVSYGLGGLQPLTAREVEENRYGDCKALTNYMLSMLKLIGIESYYTKVRAGKGRDIHLDFPSQQTNHVFLCVPNDGDTIWLECTSKNTPPNFHGYFTDDRTVLILKEDGGYLTRTKRYSAEENLQLRNAVVNISEPESVLPTKIHTIYKGQQYETVERFYSINADDQKARLLKNIDIPVFSINNFDIKTEMDGFDPTGIIDLDLEIRNYLTKSGDRYFLPLNLMNKFTYIPKLKKDRKCDVSLNYSYHNIDSVTFNLPDMLVPEYLPDDVAIESRFGEYSFRCIQEDNKILTIREIKMEKGIYPKESYPELVDFLKQICKADKSKALLKVKE